MRPACTVELYPHQSVWRAGGVVTGDVRVEVHRRLEFAACRVRLFRKLEGNGPETREVAVQSLKTGRFHADTVHRYSFELRLPEQPSFHGATMSLSWLLRAEMDVRGGRDVHDREIIEVAPNPGAPSSFTLGRGATDDRAQGALREAAGVAIATGALGGFAGLLLVGPAIGMMAGMAAATLAGGRRVGRIVWGPQVISAVQVECDVVRLPKDGGAEALSVAVRYDADVAVDAVEASLVLEEVGSFQTHRVLSVGQTNPGHRRGERETFFTLKLPRRHRNYPSFELPRHELQWRIDVRFALSGRADHVHRQVLVLGTVNDGPRPA